MAVFVCINNDSLVWPHPVLQEREGIWYNFFYTNLLCHSVQCGTNHSIVFCHMSAVITTSIRVQTNCRTGCGHLRLEHTSLWKRQAYVSNSHTAWHKNNSILNFNFWRAQNQLLNQRRKWIRIQSSWLVIQTHSVKHEMRCMYTTDQRNCHLTFVELHRKMDFLAE